jgi:hypothetical protein
MRFGWGMTQRVFSLRPTLGTLEGKLASRNHSPNG